MSNGCNNLGNTGTGCYQVMTVAKKVFFGQYFAGNGRKNTINLTPPGTVTTAGSTTLVGVGTSFLTQFAIGDVITIAGETAAPGWFTISAIASNTSLTLNRTCVTTASGLAYNVALNLAYITALINHPDPSRRLLPTPNFKSGDNTRVPGIFETFPDKTVQLVQKGPRTFKFTFTSEDKAASTKFFGILENFNDPQADIGFYVLTNKKDLWGSMNTPGYLDFIRIDGGSFEAVWNPGTDEKVCRIDVTFNIHPNEDDAVLDVIANSEMASDLQNQIGFLKGLIDVSAVYSSITAGTPGTFTVQFKTKYGTYKNPVNVTGLTKNNFYSRDANVQGDILNATTSTDQTITSVVENTVLGQPTGIYVVTTALVSTDLYELGLQANGYDFSGVNTDAGFVCP